MAMFNDSSHFCSVVDEVLAEVWCVITVNKTSVEVLVIDVCAILVIDALSDVTVGVGIDVLVGVKIIAGGTTAFVLEFALTMSYVVDMLAGVWAGASMNIFISIDVRVAVVVGMLIDALAVMLTNTIVGGVSSICADMLADTDVKMLKPVIAALEFTLPGSLKERLLLCCTP